MAHIPTLDTRALGDISFEAALAASERPTDEYDVGKWLFVPNAYTEYRYILGTRGLNPLICMGVNPSTAAPDRLDPTLKSVERIARANGYDSFIMLNVYAQRATAPGNLDESCHEALHAQNVRAFEYALSLSPHPAVWAAWGNIIEARPYLKQCLADLIRASMDLGAAWYRCSKISIKGHPHHPLYLKRDEPLQPFDAAAYLKTL